MYRPLPLLLIVDPQPDRAASLEAAFSDRYRTLVAGDVQKALEEIRSRRPAAVILDFPFPTPEGVCLSRALKEDPATAGIPIVAYSEWNYARTRATAEEYGCAAFVARPAEPEALLSAVELATLRAEPAT